MTRDPALPATTLFALLCERRPELDQAAPLPTLQRQIATWRAQHGPGREVFFRQVHHPGIVAPSTFTHMTERGGTLAGLPFPHLLFPLVLVSSNLEAVPLERSERCAALAEGIAVCLWQRGGVPRQHRTDPLSATMRPLDRAGQRQATARYAALMAHDGMEPTTNALGAAHENGAVEPALRVRGSRDFADRAADGRVSAGDRAAPHPDPARALW